jgi:predicted  nucleic acid-binding Zn-ribbon protein
VERGKLLRIDLDLAKSFEEEITKKLFNQEKANKKLKEENETIQQEKKDLENQCSLLVQQKDQEIEELNKAIHQFQRKSAKNNRSIDDMWDFLSRCYQHTQKLQHLRHGEKSTDSLLLHNNNNNNMSRSSTTGSLSSAMMGGAGASMVRIEKEACRGCYSSSINIVFLLFRVTTKTY